MAEYHAREFLEMNNRMSRCAAVFVALMMTTGLWLSPVALKAQTNGACGWMLYEGVAFPTPTPGPTPEPTLTPEPTYVPAIVVDNMDATLVGTWLRGTSAADKWATNYDFAHVGPGDSYALFVPTLPVTGIYEVLEWHPAGTNRTSNAQIIVKHATGESTHTLNQKINGGVWNSIGFFTLTAGTDCLVKITNVFSDGDVVMADAIQFAFQNTVPSPTPSPTPTPSPSSTATARPFGEYVQQDIDELEQRKATDVSGYLMKDLYGKYTGVTQTLWYKATSYMWNECAKDEVVTFGDGSQYKPYGLSYCSGLTLEIWHRAMKKRDAELGIAEASENWNGIGTRGIFIIKKLWNVIVIRYSDTGQVVSSTPCPATALSLSGLGRIITLGDANKFEDVRPYDFCDISRSTGSGHSVVFINWVRDSSDKITGFRYYSSQGSTKGQGYATEYFSDSGGSVLKSYFRAGRVYDTPQEWTTNSIREVGFY
jgi:hypothetical protein